MTFFHVCSPGELLPETLEDLKRQVSEALREDVGQGDLTAALIPSDRQSSATVISREEAVLCGRAWFDECFQQLALLTASPAVTIEWHTEEGARVSPDQRLCTVCGSARSILTGERSALNFLQLLSGVATRTRRYVEAVKGTRAQIVDTRKTLPGMRRAQKYAVTCGGGSNHRMGLHDAILIKENHILAAGGIPQAVAAATRVAETSRERCRFIQVEVETLDELDIALSCDVRMILLDNMSPEQLRQAVHLNAGRAILEASGGVNLDTVRTIAETGVDRISIGTLTKDVQALDLSLRFDASHSD